MQQPFMWNGSYQTPTPAPISPDWSGWIQRLYQSELKLQQMSEQLTSIQQQLNDIKNKPPLHIEYHFDQLKVNRLEGTLNVGLSPQGIPGIESLETPDPSCWNVKTEKPDEPAPPIGILQNEMAAYMDNQSTNDLLGLEQQFGVSLEDTHRQNVVADVKKQLNSRVQYYANTSPYPSKGTDDDKQKWFDSIKDKTTNDIQGAFTAYLSKQQQSQKGESSNP
ncbi:spore germination protein GerPC [Cohnella sp. WQ 127256]|uniref:spore germination protein GerPC n=1 Tax=Cohnella sp. WQ 127256 TaxID=2938790 RepID=UPI002119B26D|nr:spore germination protein GerPC [Cohnella sp. WQ 127256]